MLKQMSRQSRLTKFGYGTDILVSDWHFLFNEVIVVDVGDLHAIIVHYGQK